MKPMLQHNNFVISLSFLNYLKEATGMPKVMLEHQDTYLSAGISYVGLFSVKKTLPRDRGYLFCAFGLIVDGQFYGIYQMHQLIKLFASWCDQGHRLVDIHIHHLLYMHLGRIEELLSAFPSVPIKVVLHDYYAACSNFNLMKNGTQFCGGKGLSPENCRDCNAYAKSVRLEKPIMELLKKYLSRIIFISPSYATRNIYGNFHPEFLEKIRVLPHQQMQGNYKGNLQPLGDDEPLRVAYLGMPVPHKGWETWQQLVAQNSTDAYEFFVFNSDNRQYSQMEHVKITFSKDNLNAMRDALRTRNIHIVVLWSICPETYSYTCMEAWSANAMILTGHDSGNIADTVRRENCGLVLTEKEVLELFSDPVTLKQKVNDYRQQTEGGPLELTKNRDIVALTLSTAVEDMAFSAPKKQLVNYPLLWILNLLYGRQ